MRFTDIYDKYLPYWFTLIIIGVVSLLIYLSGGPTGCLDVCVFSPMMFLPFIWMGGFLTLIVIWILRVFKTSNGLISFFVIFLFLGLSFSSMYMYFYIDELKQSTSYALLHAQESADCIKNYNKLKSKYVINSYSIKPEYEKNGDILAFDLDMSIVGQEDYKVVFLANLRTESKFDYVADYGEQDIFSLEKNTLSRIKLKLKTRKKNIPNRLVGNVRIYDAGQRMSVPVTFIGKKQQSDQMCINEFPDEHIWPEYTNPKLLVQW